MKTLLLLFLLQAQTQTQWPSGWTIIGFIVGAVAALAYLFSGIIEKISAGRKDLLEVEAKKLVNLQKEKDEADFQIRELRGQLDKLEKEKAESEKDKILLMREYHQLLEVSVSDLTTLKANTKLIEKLEDEINRYREEKGLPPKLKNTNGREV